MDGFEANEGMIIVAATNRPDVLDPALLRPVVSTARSGAEPGCRRGREKILGVHAQGAAGTGRDLPRSSRAARPGFSGADLANLVNEAALLAARGTAACDAWNDFEDAKDKVMMGAERRSMAMTEEEKLTAYHEAGHAIVGLNVPSKHDPMHKATIIPRGRALGMVMQL
jgi:cell division protease FtsH